jgi:hypothetical protein
VRRTIGAEDLAMTTRARLGRRLAIGLAVAALAGANAGAKELPIQSQLGLTISTLPPIVLDIASMAQVNPNTTGNHLLSLSLASGIFHRVTRLSVTASSVAPVRGIQASTTNGAGAFGETALGRFDGNMPIHGFAKVCLFATCGQAVANVVVPLDVIGVGGTVAASAAVNVTVRGAPWTSGPLSFTTNGALPKGSRKGPLGNPSSTAQIGGTLNMVTPIFIHTNIPSIGNINAVGRLGMTYTGPPTCDVAVNAAAYLDGDAFTITTLRYASNRTDARDFRIRLYFKAPVADITVTALDFVAHLPAGFDHDIAPIQAFVVDPTQPRGDYALGCSIEDQTTAEQHVDEAAFTLQ